MMIEVERKFRLSEEQKRTIEAKIHAKDSTAAPVRQSDQVFLLGIDSFAEFKQGMPVTRLRTMNGETSFTYKRRINDAGDAVEHELTVYSADTMEAVLREMDYHLVTKVEKTRLEIHEDNIAIALDTVEDLGDFFEIEIMANDGSDLPKLEKRIMAIAADYGLSEAELETKKYDQMIAALKMEQTK